MKRGYSAVILLAEDENELMVVRYLHRQGLRDISWSIRGRKLRIHLLTHAPPGHIRELLAKTQHLFGPDGISWIPWEAFFAEQQHQRFKKLTPARPRKDKIYRPPGWGLRRFAELCFSYKTYTQVLEPTLADLETEHFEALAKQRQWKARMVVMRGYWAFWSAVAAQMPISLAKRAYALWKTSRID